MEPIKLCKYLFLLVSAIYDTIGFTAGVIPQGNIPARQSLLTPLPLAAVRMHHEYHPRHLHPANDYFYDNNNYVLYSTICYLRTTESPALLMGNSSTTSMNSIYTPQLQD